MTNNFNLDNFFSKAAETLQNLDSKHLLLVAFGMLCGAELALSKNEESKTQESNADNSSTVVAEA